MLGPSASRPTKGVEGSGLLLPVSRFTAKRVASEQGISQEKFRELSNTVDAERFTIGAKPEYLLQRYGIAVEQPVILTVGRQVAAAPYKGQDVFYKPCRRFVNDFQTFGASSLETGMIGRGSKSLPKAWASRKRSPLLEV